MSKLELSDILIIVVGGLVGLFPIMLTSILSWFDKRSRASKQHKALELAKSRIDFIERWVKVQETLNSTERFEEIKQETADELSQIRNGLSEVLVGDEESIEDNEHNLLQRIILLYRPRTFYGWVTHLVFYFILVLTIAFVISFQPGIDLDTGIFTFERLVFTDLPIIIIAFIPLIIIRVVALAIDRNATKKLNATGSG